ncbi:MAG: sulfotransferase domain-containing protein, partial [Pseudomonadales bacterium]
MTTTTRKTRPTTMEDMRARQAKMLTREEIAAGMALKLRPTDVVITPFAKCGTTWMQQIVHTLRTRGDMDFDDISRVIPWIETSTALGIDLNAEQRAEPRAFKSHLGWDVIPKGGRYINVVRDPADALVSMYKFNEGWFLEPGSVSLDEFALTGFIEQRGYYKHLKSWWPRR